MPVYAAETREEARAELSPSVEHQAQLARTVAKIALPAMAPAVRASFAPLLERMSRWTYDDVASTMGAVGTPEDCAARIEQVRRECGIGRVIAWVNFGGLVPHAAVTRSMRLFARGVMPAFV